MAELKCTKCGKLFDKDESNSPLCPNCRDNCDSTEEPAKKTGCFRNCLTVMGNIILFILGIGTAVVGLIAAGILIALILSFL